MLYVHKCGKGEFILPGFICGFSLSNDVFDDDMHEKLVLIHCPREQNEILRN